MIWLTDPLAKREDHGRSADTIEHFSSPNCERAINGSQRKHCIDKRQIDIALWGNYGHWIGMIRSPTLLLRRLFGELPMLELPKEI